MREKMFNRLIFVVLLVVCNGAVIPSWVYNIPFFWETVTPSQENSAIKESIQSQKDWTLNEEIYEVVNLSQINETGEDEFHNCLICDGNVEAQNKYMTCLRSLSSNESYEYCCKEYFNEEYCINITNIEFQSFCNNSRVMTMVKKCLLDNNKSDICKHEIQNKYCPKTTAVSSQQKDNKKSILKWTSEKFHYNKTEEGTTSEVTATMVKRSRRQKDTFEDDGKTTAAAETRSPLEEPSTVSDNPLGEPSEESESPLEEPSGGEEITAGTEATVREGTTLMEETTESSGSVEMPDNEKADSCKIQALMLKLLMKLLPELQKTSQRPCELSCNQFRKCLEKCRLCNPSRRPKTCNPRPGKCMPRQGRFCTRPVKCHRRPCKSESGVQESKSPLQEPCEVSESPLEEPSGMTQSPLEEPSGVSESPLEEPSGVSESPLEEPIGGEEFTTGTEATVREGTTLGEETTETSGSEEMPDKKEGKPDNEDKMADNKKAKSLSKIQTLTLKLLIKLLPELQKTSQRPCELLCNQFRKCVEKCNLCNPKPGKCMPRPGRFCPKPVKCHRRPCKSGSGVQESKSPLQEPCEVSESPLEEPSGMTESPLEEPSGVSESPLEEFSGGGNYPKEENHS